jgi:pimeloyl-ACP methyl ester carboxylesterase
MFIRADDAAIVEKVTINSKVSPDSKESIARRGILVRYPSARATIVICHGFMCDKFDVGFVRQLFPKGSFNFLSFDFRAHGEDTKGQCCTFGRDEALDVIAAANFVKTHPDLKKLPVMVYGFSMGAVASIEAQAKQPDLFKAMILDCPFDSSENVVKKALANLKFNILGYEFEMPGRQLMEKYVFHPYVQEFVKFVLKTVGHMDAKNIQTYIYRFSPAESIKKVEFPCLFIHCKEDKRVPVDAIRSIYNGAQGPKRLWVTNGRGHYDSFFYNPEKYSRHITTFFNEVITGQLGNGPKEHVAEDEDEHPAPIKAGV